jgi:hypothetical protein
LNNQIYTANTPNQGLVVACFFRIINIRNAIPKSAGIKKQIFIKIIHDG